MAARPPTERSAVRRSVQRTSFPGTYKGIIILCCCVHTGECQLLNPSITSVGLCLSVTMKLRPIEMSRCISAVTYLHKPECNISTIYRTTTTNSRNDKSENRRQDIFRLWERVTDWTETRTS